MAASSSPIVIDIRRNGVAESMHRVHGIALDHNGILGSWGDTGSVIYPRSTLKPVQALPLIETGAAAKFALSPQEIALSCASHNGEDAHVALARAWMQRASLKEADFECGSHWPYQRDAEHALCASGQKPCSLHNNCSGKHLGMLTACLHNGWETLGYTRQDHPLQRRILETFAELSGFSLQKTVVGIDGCSAPNPALPLENIARGFLNLMKLESGMTLLSAMTQNPFFVAGTDRFDTKVMEASGGKLVCKIGAEGSVVIFNLENKNVLYLKCEDGNTRATHTAAAFVMAQMKWLASDAITEYARPVTKNWRGIFTGDIVVRN